MIFILNNYIQIQYFNKQMGKFLVLEKKCINIRHILDITKFDKGDVNDQRDYCDKDCYQIRYGPNSLHMYIYENETDYLRIKEFIKKLLDNNI